MKISSGNFYWVNARLRLLYSAEKARISGKKPAAIAQVRGSTLTASPPPVLGEPLLDELDRSLDDSLIDSRLVLRDINLVVPKGSSVAIIGKVGSGKSSLLSAILGELYWEKGSKVQLSGNLAYLGQNPWLVSGTIKEAILFGLPLEKEKLESVVKCSGLEEDLKHLPHGIDTMLGDRGINLSGGQKTRVNLARCFYADKDIYLLDDPISALDVNVAKHVMEAGIVGLLKNKTRIVTTHALAFLSYFDHVVILEEGRVVVQGTTSEVMATEAFQILKGNIEREDLQRKLSTNDRESIDSEDQIEQDKPLALKKKMSELGNLPATKTDRLIEGIMSAEDKARGRVINRKVLASYCKLLGGKRIVALAFMGMLSLPSSASLGSL